MRAFALVDKQRIEERFLPDPPDPGPGEILVKLKTVGICGSEMHWHTEGGIGNLTGRRFPCWA